MEPAGHMFGFQHCLIFADDGACWLCSQSRLMIPLTYSAGRSVFDLVLPFAWQDSDIQPGGGSRWFVCSSQQ